MVILRPRNEALATSDDNAPSISRTLAEMLSARYATTSSVICAPSFCALARMILSFVS